MINLEHLEKVYTDTDNLSSKMINLEHLMFVGI